MSYVLLVYTHEDVICFRTYSVKDDVANKNIADEKTTRLSNGCILCVLSGLNRHIKKSDTYIFNPFSSTYKYFGAYVDRPNKIHTNKT